MLSDVNPPRGGVHLYSTNLHLYSTNKNDVNRPRGGYIAQHQRSIRYIVIEISVSIMVEILKVILHRSKYFAYKLCFETKFTVVSGLDLNDFSLCLFRGQS